MQATCEITSLAALYVVKRLVGLCHRHSRCRFDYSTSEYHGWGRGARRTPSSGTRGSKNFRSQARKPLQPCSAAPTTVQLLLDHYCSATAHSIVSKQVFLLLLDHNHCIVTSDIICLTQYFHSFHIKSAGRSSSASQNTQQEDIITSIKFASASKEEHHYHILSHPTQRAASLPFFNHHYIMSPSNNSSIFVAQDFRRDSTSSHRSLKGALQWLSQKMTENELSEQTRRNSYEGIMPSPYESTTAYHARMNANKQKGFW